MPDPSTARLDTLSRIGRALGDPTRCQLLLALLDGPAYPGELAMRLGLTRANTSNHLTCLRGCGLVTGEPEGRRVRYRLADASLARALLSLADLSLVVDPAAVCLDGRVQGTPLVATSSRR
jgi:DNA-binding transcriptional ArsR family regulator